MKRLIRLGIFLVIAVVLGLFGVFTWMSWQQANQFVFVPRRTIQLVQNMPTYQNIEFSSNNVSLRGWFLAPSRDDGASILFVHGHGGNRNDFDEWAAAFAAEGYGLLLFDLHAQGESDGERITMGVTEAEDVKAAFNYLIAQDGINPERIAIFGHSMGAATSILATAQIPQIRCILVSAPYSSIRNVLNDRIPTTVGFPSLFFPDMIVGMSSYLSGADYSLANPLAVVGEIHQPIIFMAGSSDDTIPPSHSQILYDAANEPKELHYIEGANHNDMFDVRFSDFLAVVRPFLERYLINE
jgi:fermentation-respiration switch protein FrsA (DUF1100 family)